MVKNGIFLHIILIPYDNSIQENHRLRYYLDLCNIEEFERQHDCCISG